MKKIIIIGATSGIGRGLAEAYVQEDCLIGITGRRENLLQDVSGIKINYSIKYATSPKRIPLSNAWKHSYKKWVEWIY